MAEVKVFDSVLQNVASSLYKSKPKLQFPEKNWIVNGVLKLLGLSKGPVEVELTDVPTVSISQRGVSADINAGVTSVAKRHKAALPVTCHVDMKVDIRGKRLILLSQNVKCEIKGNKRKFMKAIVNLFLKIAKERVESKIEQKFDKGVQVPLPEGLDVTRIDYHDGFLVLRAALTQEKTQQVVDQLMAKMNVFKT